MSFSYDHDLSSDKDKVRFRIGDTDESLFEFSDEEIAAVISQEGSVVKAALALAESMLAKYSRFVDEKAGQVDIKHSSRTTQIEVLIRKLRRSLSLSASPYAGGLSKAEKKTDRDDTDLVQPKFEKNTHKHDGVEIDTTD